MADIRTFLANNESMDVDVSPGVSYSLRKVINDNYRLYNAKFESEGEAGGLEKIFYRISWVIYRTIIMSSDLSIKDMNMRSLNGVGIRVLSLLKMAAKSHMLRTFFGKYIDRVMSEIVWFGSSITKRANGTVYTVDLRNYVTQATVKDPQDRSHAEMCYYDYDEMLSYKDDWAEKWEDVELLWEKMQKQNLSQFTVIEFWTWKEMNGKVHKVCEKHLDRSLLREDQQRNTTDWSPYVLLETFKTPYKSRRESKFMRDKLGEYEEMFPYEQADFFDAPGRWLAFGCGELLAGLQEHYNEMGNNKRKMDLLGLRGIFVHKYTNSSNSLTQEFLDNLETGSVLSMDVDEDLSRLVIDTKTNEFIASMDKLYELARLIMGIQAVSAGEKLPSNTATEAVINQGTQATTYDYVRGQMHHFLTRLFQNGYFEDIINELTEKELIAILGDPEELLELDKFFVTQQVNRAFEEIKATEGMYPTQEVYDALVEQISQAHAEHGDMRFVALKKELLKSLEFYVEFYVKNESFDKNTKIQNLIALKNDPSFTGSRDAVQKEILDLMDINSFNFKKTAEEKAREVEMAREMAMATAAGEVGGASGMMPPTAGETVTPTRAYTRANVPPVPNPA